MLTIVDALMCDMLAWIAASDRTYAEVMEDWRTSCPRLPVWEDAVDRGYIAHTRVAGRALVSVTKAGRTFLAKNR